MSDPFHDRTHLTGKERPRAIRTKEGLLDPRSILAEPSKEENPNVSIIHTIPNIQFITHQFAELSRLNERCSHSYTSQCTWIGQKQINYRRSFPIFFNPETTACPTICYERSDESANHQLDIPDTSYQNRPLSHIMASWNFRGFPIRNSSIQDTVDPEIISFGSPPIVQSFYGVNTSNFNNISYDALNADLHFRISVLE
jgi:hypothetical protein